MGLDREILESRIVTLKKVLQHEGAINVFDKQNNQDKNVDICPVLKWQKL